MAAEQTWRTIANRTSRKINFGWWLQVLATPLLITALLIACGILIVRRELDALPWLEIGAGTVAALALTGVACWLAARKHFETSQQSLVRLEASMRLRNALTAADHGIAPWPQVPAIINDGTSWRWQRLAPPLVGALLIIACGFLIPIHAKSAPEASTQEPSAWNELDTSLDQLDNQEVVQQEYVDEMREKLEKLREQSPDEWFSHSSLEATDNLKKSHANEQEALKNNLQRAERNLAELQQGGGKMNQEKKQRLLNEFDQALQKMEQGGMKPNEELLKQLQKLDPNELGNLTPEQLDQLRENMRQHAEKLKQQGEGKGDQPGEGEDDWMNDPEGEGEDGEGDQPGQGGINRGPGTAPDVLGDPHADAGKGKLERLQNDNKDQALPGDLLQTSDGKHDVDQTPTGPTAGGAASNKGQGGDRVWKDSLLPEEQKALKKFFK
ncbi:hypothetical protein JO972_04750 [Verrucomicrobiaceae bacterium 5K15]|uniref:Uncharacterized protein n=1 Tax=Oceaniferula flava TaxID=2800421 RepID=A0AAE2SC12_9BACT|nr:hypothetical protein [Oceaniferula flavus]MBK1854252.1 hypothetical protein [Oceaniferula flavus]MBM1135558.1 hypothetical protein [Oceaniferula flavus]